MESQPTPRITAQFPRLQWRPNPAGETRSIEEAVAIARRAGVHVAGDVAFFVAEGIELLPGEFARGPDVTKAAGQHVAWTDLVHDRTGKVPFLIRADVLASDEAIVAVFTHEMHELEALRALLADGTMTIEQFAGCVCPGNPGNFHDEAWDVADAAVERMRREVRP